MAEQSNISWTDATFNPWMGCSKVSPACKHCYAERDMDHRYGKVKWGDKGTRSLTSRSNWAKPKRWNSIAERQSYNCIGCGGLGLVKKKFPCASCNGTGTVDRRQRVFCASLADVFEDWQGRMLGSTGYPIMHGSRLVTNGVPSDWVERPLNMNDARGDLFALIDATPNLDWLLLTKRPENILRMWCSHLNTDGKPPSMMPRDNVWLGTTVESQEYADKRIPELLECRDLSPVLFLSCEPLLGPVEFSDVSKRADAISQLGKKALSGIDWVIAGGESGPDARPSHPEWFRSLRDQCEAAAVPFHFKQWGEYVPGDHDSVTMADDMRTILPWHDKEGSDITPVVRVGVKRAGRLLDGALHDAFPVVEVAS